PAHLARARPDPARNGEPPARRTRRPGPDPRAVVRSASHGECGRRRPHGTLAGGGRARPRGGGDGEPLEQGDTLGALAVGTLPVSHVWPRRGRTLQPGRGPVGNS